MSDYDQIIHRAQLLTEHIVSKLNPILQERGINGYYSIDLAPTFLWTRDNVRDMTHISAIIPKDDKAIFLIELYGQSLIELARERLQTISIPEELL
jgi:hypothetical protein